MTTSSKYLLDANTFITAKNDHYGFEFCQGYWSGLLKAYEKKRLASIAPIRKELVAEGDVLSDWVKDECPKSFFKKVDDIAVRNALNSINDWVVKNKQYMMAAKQKFLSGADPWLVAYAQVNDYIITSYEVSAPDSRAKVKLPDVASSFNVTCALPFEMLRDLRFKLRFSGNIK